MYNHLYSCITNRLFLCSYFRTESELLKDIVGDVLRKLTPRYPNQLKGLVGIEDNYEKVESLLKIGSSEVITLGIWGMGGQKCHIHRFWMLRDNDDDNDPTVSQLSQSKARQYFHFVLK